VGTPDTSTSNHADTRFILITRDRHTVVLPFKLVVQQVGLIPPLALPGRQDSGLPWGLPFPMLREQGMDRVMVCP